MKNIVIALVLLFTCSIGDDNTTTKISPMTVFDYTDGSIDINDFTKQVLKITKKIAHPNDYTDKKYKADMRRDARMIYIYFLEYKKAENLAKKDNNYYKSKKSEYKQIIEKVMGKDLDDYQIQEIKHTHLKNHEIDNNMPGIDEETAMAIGNFDKITPKRKTHTKSDTPFGDINLYGEARYRNDTIKDNDDTSNHNSMLVNLSMEIFAPKKPMTFEQKAQNDYETWRLSTKNDDELTVIKKRYIRKLNEYWDLKAKTQKNNSIDKLKLNSLYYEVYRQYVFALHHLEKS